jgi:hypothetical protein
MAEMGDGRGHAAIDFAAVLSSEVVKNTGAYVEKNHVIHTQMLKRC